jgi:hypothetical protein
MGSLLYALFPLSGSSVRGSCLCVAQTSLTLPAVDFVVAVAVKHY